MVTQQTIDIARTAAAELRGRGEIERAEAIEALIQSVSERPRPLRAKAPLPAADGLTEEDIPNLFGATGQMIKQWVQEGKLVYRVGRFLIPREVVEEYVRLAGASLDLEEVSDEEATRLIAEGRQRG